MELRRPKIEKAEWQDADGKSIDKGIAGIPIKLYAEVTEFEEGQGVTFTVYNARTGEAVYEAGSDVQDAKAEALWTYHWDGEELKEKPKYYFEVTANRCKPVKSTEVKIGAKIKFSIVDILDNKPETYKIYLITPDGSKEEINLADDCSFEKDDIIPGKYIIIAEKKDNE